MLNNRSRLALCALLLTALACQPEIRPLTPCPTVGSFLASLGEEASLEGRIALARSYLASQEGESWPPWEDGKIHFFFWKEEGEGEPGVALSALGWRPEALRLKSLFGTPLFYASYPVAEHEDFTYWIVDQGSWRRDPLNPLVGPDALKHLASRIELIARGRPEWASRDPLAPRGRLEKSYLGGSWFVPRTAWIYHSPASIFRFSSGSEETHKIEGLLVLELKLDESQAPILANCLDKAFLGSGARRAIICLEGFGQDASQTGWGFSELASREAPGLIKTRGGLEDGYRLAIAGTKGRASHLLVGLAKSQNFATSLYLFNPDLGFRWTLDYWLGLAKSGYPANRLILRGGADSYWVNLLEKLGDLGVKTRLEPAGPSPVADNLDQRLETVYRLVLDWLAH